MSQGYQLAQLNIARLIYPLDAPQTADFADNLDRINALAEAQPGFVWRLVGEDGNATDVRIDPDPMMIVNLSVWRDIEALTAFAYRTDHRDIMRRRREWFHPLDAFLVLWWIPTGHRPTTSEAIRRLEYLVAHGPTVRAFTFKTTFSAPEVLTVDPVACEGVGIR